MNNDIREFIPKGLGESVADAIAAIEKKSGRKVASFVFRKSTVGGKGAGSTLVDVTFAEEGRENHLGQKMKNGVDSPSRQLAVNA